MHQDDLDQREALLKRDGMLIGIAGLSLLNGMHFSPIFDPAFIIFRAFAPGFFLSSPLLLFYFTSLLLSAATLVIAGIPAALYERFSGRTETNVFSLGIWLAATAALSAPSLLTQIGVF
ncbi:MAG: hypothetical protein HC850_02075 [Rhodomicrobium sp.]|nr:hypothetical protein [Rhodomicrobium sp.]